MDIYSIAGGWLGTYHYDSGQEPCRFEANFHITDWNGGFRGRILDDSDLGEANVEGMQTALTVIFHKMYVSLPERYSRTPIAYKGEISEDGKRMVGTWEVEGWTGTWEARRLWFETVEEDVRSESEGLLVGAR